MWVRKYVFLAHMLIPPFIFHLARRGGFWYDKKKRGFIMTEKLFYFDFVNKSYTDEEIKARADWYVNKAMEGIRISQESKKEARNILFFLNGHLKAEMKEYDKLVSCRAPKSNLAKQYTRAINDAYVKQTRINAYDMVTSNLDDIQDYMGLWKPGYGNVMADK